MKDKLISLLFIGLASADSTCVNDDSVTDRDGDTCSSYYDLDNSLCGIYDTEEFTAADACCACQQDVPVDDLNL